MLGERTLFTNKAGEWHAHVDDLNCRFHLAGTVTEMTMGLWQPGHALIVLCIGTDRCTGDALGPLIGTRLKKGGLRHVYVHGTLENPVHATNLRQTMESLRQRHEKRLIIAVDACLGKIDSVGKIVVGKGPLKPGAGVNKDLPPVGDLFITGIVNVGGFMDYMVLQNTRLYFITRLAEVIGDGLLYGLRGLERTPFAACTIDPWEKGAINKG